MLMNSLLYYFFIVYLARSKRPNTPHFVFKPIVRNFEVRVLKGKCVFFVKLHVHSKSANDRDITDCNDTGSLEACIWKNRANFPVFAEFLLSFSPLSKHDTSYMYSTYTSLKFLQPFWVVIQWLKTDNTTFIDF